MAANTPKRFRAPSHWTLAQRVNHYVDKSDGPDACWPWTGSTLGGYGGLNWMGRAHLAHRLSWIATHGPISDGLVVCHHCDNPPCCNPAHLFCDTQKGNMTDAATKGRVRGGIKLGASNGNAKLTESMVRDIRAAIKTEGPRAIARRLGVNRETVRQVLRGNRWGHVT